MLPKNYSHYLIAAIFILINLVIKVIYIDSRDIAMDEPFSIWWAQHGVHDIWGMLADENNPALHFLFLHFWIKLFGTGALAVRLLSVIFSAVTAGLIYLTGAKFFRKGAGIFAASFFTFSTLQLYFAHEARVYALFELLAAWGIYLMLAIMHQPRRRWLFTALFICNLLLIYSHYLGWVAVAAQFIVMMWLPVRKQIWKPLLIVYALLVISYIPYLQIFFERLGSFTEGTWVRRPEVSELYGNINRFVNSRYVSLVFIILSAGVIIYAAVKKTLRETIAGDEIKSAMPLAAWFVFTYAGMFVVSFAFPVFLDRYILFTTPVLYLLMALLIAFSPLPGSLRWLFFAVVAGIMLCFFNLNPDNNRRVGELVRTVRVLKQPGTVVIISPEYSDLEFVYHYDPDAFRDYRNTRARLNSDNIFPARSVAQLPAGLLDAAGHVLYIDCGSVFAFGRDDMGEALRSRFTETRKFSVFEIYTVREFLPGDKPPVPVGH